MISFQFVERRGVVGGFMTLLQNVFSPRRPPEAKASGSIYQAW